MTNEQKTAIETLVCYGFSYDTAKMMIRAGELSLPLKDTVRINSTLLARYISLNGICGDQYWKILRFLTRDFHTNERMAAVPERYVFTEEQTRAYFDGVLDWEITSDLKEKLDAALTLIIPDIEERTAVYREMYCNGAWSDCDTICNICRELQHISRDHAGIEEIVRKWWRTWFAYYSGTLQYICLLKEMFKPEAIWNIFCETSANAHELTEHFHPFDRKDQLIEELKKEYAACLMDKEDTGDE